MPILPSSTPALLIFDCDGVLIDSEPIAGRLCVTMLAELGYEIELAAFQRLATGRSRTQWMAALGQHFGQPLPNDFPDRLADRLRDAFEAALQPMPGIEAALAAIDLPRCVASSSDPARLRHTLGLTGLWPIFAPYVFSAVEVARGKPAPDLFLHAARRLGVAPEAAIVIEDSEAGVLAGVAAGMTVLGFAGGGHCGPEHATRLRAAGAGTVFDDMRELPPLINRRA
jgi:HAD superfamily hydrolase (TIGR01509 family)